MGTQAKTAPPMLMNVQTAPIVKMVPHVQTYMDHFTVTVSVDLLAIIVKLTSMTVRMSRVRMVVVVRILLTTFSVIVFLVIMENSVNG